MEFIILLRTNSLYGPPVYFVPFLNIYYRPGFYYSPTTWKKNATNLPSPRLFPPFPGSKIFLEATRLWKILSSYLR